ncbi:MAG: FAD-dependent monooxygenase [Proteobacteria bacterium]|nr:FAD-dependent monooxygenase [Pseudomonadota bacterium]
MARCDVLIVGAGPTGLVLALWLTQQGVQVRIVDTSLQPGTTSRALAVQARTLELYRQLGLDRDVIAQGYKVPAVNLWVRGEPVARVAFGDIGARLTPFSFLEIFPQDQHEALLVEKLISMGVVVERRTELVSFTDHADRIRARLRTREGAEQVCEAAYLAGCDGARSRVRQGMGSGFPGGTYRQVFYVADIQGTGPPLDGSFNADLDEADFLGVFPMAGTGRARLIGTVRDERAEHAESLTFEDVSARAIANLKVKVDQVNWFSTYRVHHRVADRFRKGRAFILGDAAHIHSPAGGQGMNTGIGDAVNLAWKLAAVIHGRAADALLDSYEMERLPFAQRLVATTDRAFSFVTADGPLADIVRTRVAPVVLSRALALESVRDFMFRTVSQIALNYRDRPLSAGRAGDVHGGDRLPWVAAAGEDNHEPLQSMSWQVHVYGTPRGGLDEWCVRHGVRLHVFPWTEAHARAGLLPDALYLIRPDTYVALAEGTGEPAALQKYFAEHRLRAGP